MQSASEQSSVIENRMNELVAEYLHSIQAGQGLDRKQLLLEHPALAGRLQEFFDDHDWMHGLAREPFFPDEESVLNDSEMSLGTTIIGVTASRPRASQNGNEKSATPLGTFGDYDLLKEIGRGGMGVIYKARQRGLNRNVALKMIRSNHLASQEEVDRFRGEAELAAGLDHPGIVPIFEVGEQAGQHYYSMGLVEADGPMPGTYAVRIVLGGMEREKFIGENLEAFEKSATIEAGDATEMNFDLTSPLREAPGRK